MSTTLATPTTTQRLTDELTAADNAHTAAVQAAVGGYGDWFHARQAAEVVRQCRAASKAAGGDHE
jgi:hypothetical protein